MHDPSKLLMLRNMRVQVTWNYKAGAILRDDVAALDFGFLPALSPEGRLELCAVDLPEYIPGSLGNSREFACCCTPNSLDTDGNGAVAALCSSATSAWQPRQEAEVSRERNSILLWQHESESKELGRLKRRLAAFPSSAAQDAELLATAGAGLGPTERLLIELRMRRKQALADAITALSSVDNQAVVLSAGTL